VAALAMGAAVAAVLLAWRLWTREVELEDGGRLGGPGIVLLAPVGAGADFAAFRWQVPPEAAWFELVVRDAASGAELARGEDLRGSSWHPASDTTRWPAAIRWELTAFDRSGASVGLALGHATR
jgi:hypothetical protein